MIQRGIISTAMLALILFASPAAAQQSVLNSQSGVGIPKSDVYLQGFYWNSTPGGLWYDSLAALAPRLASAGFGAVWFPPPQKGAGGGFSMGYDPYDHYDFGEFYQKGSVPTRFGTRKQLENAIGIYHQHGLQVFADAVTRHMNGGEALIPVECKPYPSYADSAYLLFQYPNGSGRFPKNAHSFYPNGNFCSVDPPYRGASDPIFQFGSWLAHEEPAVRDSMIVWGKYLREVLKFDGLRLDAVKNINPVFMGTWVKAVNNGGYAVAELWSNESDIGSWLSTAKAQGAQISMFDFPLRYVLKDMCNAANGTFDMRTLDGAGLINKGFSGFDVSTFLENHDFDRTGWDGQTASGHDPVLYDKQLGYAYLIFSEGRPCVFFKDYMMYGIGGVIDTLVYVRQHFISGGTTKRSGLNPYYIRDDNNADQNALAANIYIARRDGGYDSKPGTYLVINNNPTHWIDIYVDTELPVGTVYKDFAGRDANKTVTTPAPGGTKNRIKLWAPPRSFTLYVPDTSRINYPPVLNRIPAQTAYTNSAFTYQLVYSDANNAQLTVTLTAAPKWLSVSATGLLKGTPAMSDTGTAWVKVRITDPYAVSDIDSFTVRVLKNLPPKFRQVNDTTAVVTRRFQLTMAADDPDHDSLAYSLLAKPAWLNIGERTGIVSGTPAPSDTGSTLIRLLAADGKGAFDTTAFRLTVTRVPDSVLFTYAKPSIDGTVSISASDWKTEWRIAVDPDTDSFWWDRTKTPDNELYALFATWDADSLYLGVDYYLNDKNNTQMLFVSTGGGPGITNFNANQGYNGDYAKNFRFPASAEINIFTASYYLNKPDAFKISGNTSTVLKSYGVRSPNARGNELSIAWDDIYGLGAGLVPPHVRLQLVAVVAGGYNWGAGDAMPDNPVTGTAGPDSLIHLAALEPDKNGDGIPDPTVKIVLAVKEPDCTFVPAGYVLHQNYPNPFNPSTTIVYMLPEQSRVTLTIYDVLGRKVAVLADGIQTAGMHNVQWHPQTASGMYFYRLEASPLNRPEHKERLTRKLMFVQ